MAVYNPFEGQVFDVNDLLNEFEIEIIFSATIMNNLLTDNLSAITVTIINSDTNQNIKRFVGGTDFTLDDIDSGGYLKLNWNIYDRRVNNVLVGNYRIEISTSVLP